MLALAGQPSLDGNYACMVYWTKGAPQRNCRQTHGKTSFSPFRVFLPSRNSRERFWGLVTWHLWIGRARHPGPSFPSHHFGIEVLNVGGWLAHGDLALDTGVDFLAVVEHRLIPARVRSEWSRLRKKDLASVWSPASQVSSHVGNAGVGVVSLRGAPFSLPTFATAQFRRFFDSGRAVRCMVRCMVPLGFGRFMHLVVLCGFQGADSDAEQLSLTEQLFDAALGELSVVARGQPCLLVGDFNVEPTKIPCLAKGILAGLWVDLEAAWALAAGIRPAVTCKRTWGSAGGHRRDFMVACPLAVAAVSSCKVLKDRWIAPHLAVRIYLIVVGGLVLLLRLFSVLPFGLLLGYLQLIRVGVPSLLRFGGFWEVYDERLQFMSCRDALLLDASLADDVSQAWAVLVWCC